MFSKCQSKNTTQNNSVKPFCILFYFYFQMKLIIDIYFVRFSDVIQITSNSRECDREKSNVQMRAALSLKNHNRLLRARQLIDTTRHVGVLSPFWERDRGPLDMENINWAIDVVCFAQDYFDVFVLLKITLILKKKKKWEFQAVIGGKYTLFETANEAEC